METVNQLDRCSINTVCVSQLSQQGSVSRLLSIPTDAVLHCSLSEHVFFSYPSPAGRELILEPMSPSHFFKVRADPTSYAWNMHCDSITEQAREINSFKDLNGFLIADLTTKLQSRDPLSLYRLSQKTGVQVVMGAAPDTETETSDYQPDTVDKLAQELVGELILGVKIGHLGVQGEFEDENYCTKAAFIGALDLSEMTNIGQAHQPPWNTALAAVARAVSKTGAPVVLKLPHFCLLAVDLADLLKTLGIPAAKVIFTGMHSFQPLEYHKSLLSKGVNLCFDTFGSLQYYSGPEQLPNDEELCVRISELLLVFDQEFSGEVIPASQLLLSSGVRYGMQLQKYGGFGYGHVMHAVLPRLQRLGVDEKDIDLMLRKNLLCLLAWYEEPEVEKEPEEHLTCSFCKKDFRAKLGEYYTKFEFVYCKSKCLNAHRKANWTKDLL